MKLLALLSETLVVLSTTNSATDFQHALRGWPQPSRVESALEIQTGDGQHLY